VQSCATTLHDHARQRHAQPTLLSADDEFRDDGGFVVDAGWLQTEPLSSYESLSYWIVAYCTETQTRIGEACPTRSEDSSKLFFALLVMTSSERSVPDVAQILHAAECLYRRGAAVGTASEITLATQYLAHSPVCRTVEHKHIDFFCLKLPPSSSLVDNV
jgi:hypothetical protein